MDSVAAEVTHGFELPGGCIDGTSLSCESLAPTSVSNVISRLGGKFIHAYSEKPMPPLEHPVTRTTVLLRDMFRPVGCVGKGT